MITFLTTDCELCSGLSKPKVRVIRAEAAPIVNKVACARHRKKPSAEWRRFIPVPSEKQVPMDRLLNLGLTLVGAGESRETQLDLNSGYATLSPKEDSTWCNLRIKWQNQPNPNSGSLALSVHRLPVFIANLHDALSACGFVPVQWSHQNNGLARRLLYRNSAPGLVWHTSIQVDWNINY